MSEGRKWCVYKHTNKVNGKIYIGITSKNPQDRWKNGKGYFKGSYFRSAIDKYGWDNFTHEILIKNIDENLAKTKESELIKYFQSNQRLFGYNLTNGGDGVVGYKFSDEQKQKMSQSRKGIPLCWMDNGEMPIEVRKKISKSRIGMKFSETHIKNLKDSHIGKKHSDDWKDKVRTRCKCAKKIICLETLEIFNFISDAIEKHPNVAHHIGECCQGKRLSCGGLHWMYYEDYIKRKEDN